MDIFNHGGKKFISINGKDYFLIRGYGRNRDKLIFVQVYGKTPLRKEDLPTKDWDIVRSRSGIQQVWTAFQKKYFRYDTQASDPTLVFVGASTQGSYFIALMHVCGRFGIEAKDETLNRLAARYSSGELDNYHLDRLKDDGNSGVDAVLIGFDSFFKEEDAKKLLEGSDT